jgi:class 3 adenylate cyclase
MQNELGQFLDIKIGIHTGKVVAGIIGSKVVRYDIFGEGVFIGHKIVQAGLSGKVTISEETKQLIMSQPEVAREYNIEPFKRVDLKMISRSIMSHTIVKNEELSHKDVEDSRNSYGDDLLDDDQS